MIFITACGESTPGRDELHLSDALDLGEHTGFVAATKKRNLQFPQDHAVHPEYKTEWWYFNGNLQDRNNRRFAYHLTFFRVGLKYSDDREEKKAREIYMAHFAISNIDNQTHHYQQRLSRPALGLAGYDATSATLNVENWRIERTAAHDFRLEAETAEGRIELNLDGAKSPVLHGEQGLVDRGPEVGNASYYYSLTRLDTRGTLRLAGEQYRVTGQSWMDHEWFTLPPTVPAKTWDWFALQLDDNSEIMYYQLRDAENHISAYSAGTFIHPDGRQTELKQTDIRLRINRHEQVPSGYRYPLSWHIEHTGLDLELDISALMIDQETAGVVRYWEGAVSIHGHRKSTPVSGLGFAELTGYESRSADP